MSACCTPHCHFERTPHSSTLAITNGLDFPLFVSLTNYPHPYSQLTSMEIGPRPRKCTCDLGRGNLLEEEESGMRYQTQESAESRQSPSRRAQNLLLSWNVLQSMYWRVWAVMRVLKHLCRGWYMWAGEYSQCDYKFPVSGTSKDMQSPEAKAERSGQKCRKTGTSWGECGYPNAGKEVRHPIRAV